MSDEQALAERGQRGFAAPNTFRRQVALAEAFLEAGDRGTFRDCIRVLEEARDKSKSYRTRMRASDLLLKHAARVAELDRSKDHGFQFENPVPVEPAPASPSIQVSVQVNLSNRPSGDDVRAALSALVEGAGQVAGNGRAKA